jgi:hypothetical protein
MMEVSKVLKDPRAVHLGWVLKTKRSQHGKLEMMRMVPESLALGGTEHS